MPGLVGIVTTQTANTEKLLSKMCHAIKHEKWYKTDTYVNKTVGLGRVHLGIFNPELQPLFNEDKTVCILMDGEIYDYQKMKEDLVSKGHEFSVDNDPEFILHLYEEYGTDFVHKLNGSFTLVIWNEKSHELLIINDRYGLRPLYYTEHNGYLLFGSEVKAILRDETFKRIVDDRSVADFFSFGYILGDKTFFRGIELLPPASILTYNNTGHVSIEEYWIFNFNEENEVQTEGYYVEKFSNLLLQAVERQMDGEFRFGVPLSGGLDSRVIAASIYKKHYPLDTFTFGKPNCDDARFAQKVANKLGTQHHFFEFKLDDLAFYAEKAVYLTDGLLNCIHAHRTMQTSGEMREYIDVALSGMEALWCFVFPITEMDARKDSYIQSTDDMVLFQPMFIPLSYGFRKQLFSQSYYSKIKNYPSKSIKNIRKKIPKNSMKISPFKMIEYYDLTQRQRRFAVYGPVIMRSKIEVRIPLLDNNLMDFVFTLPPELRTEDKLISVKTIVGIFPELISIPWQKTGLPITPSNLQLEIHNKIKGVKRRINRITGKKIFEDTKKFADYDDWMRDNKKLKEYILNILLDERALARPYFNPKSIKEILDLHMSGKENHSELIGRLLTFELWHRLFFD
jgi:asparagine synthase (glutamine-hydrolysing)